MIIDFEADMCVCVCVLSARVRKWSHDSTNTSTIVETSLVIL